MKLYNGKIIDVTISISMLFATFCKAQQTESKTSDKVHAFYYAWYGNPKNDGAYHHWNHDILPHWSDKTWDNAGGFSGTNKDIGADFYPKLGTYSSKDTVVIAQHLRWMRAAGIGVFVMSWWGKKDRADLFTNTYLDLAQQYGLKMGFHIEPFYKDATSFKKAIQYLHEQYGEHPAVFKWNGKPLYYVYDSYKLKTEAWASLLKPNGNKSLRGKPYDGVFIGLWVHKNEGEFFTQGGFDGFYTYFASDGFVYGSTTKNWDYLSDFAKENDLIFIPCAGPGYLDTRIRPWNAKNTKKRNKGIYYEKMFHAAIESKPTFIGITSFNEWHEGTQIEPAIPAKTKDYRYRDYGKNTDPEYYLKKTRELVENFEQWE